MIRSPNARAVCLALILPACGATDDAQTPMPSPTPVATLAPGNTCAEDKDTVLRIHYQNSSLTSVYSNLYMWTWNAWTPEKDIPSCGTDSFGVVFEVSRQTFTEEGAGEGTAMGFKFKQNEGTGGPWYEMDRAWVWGEDPWEVWVVAGDPSVYSAASEALLPKMAAAWWDSLTEATVEFDRAITGMTDLSRWRIDGATVEAVEGIDDTSVKLTFSPLQITGAYTLFFESGGGQIVGQLFPRKVMDPYVTDEPLGSWIEGDSTHFAIWTPRATEVILHLSDAPDGAETAAVTTTRNEKGVWSATLPGNLDGTWYWYTIDGPGGTGEHFDKSVPLNDPWSAVAMSSFGGVAGRSMVVDLDRHLPLTNPVPITRVPREDLIVYEAHIRDLTGGPDSGVDPSQTDAFRRYLGWTLEGTRTSGGLTTGLDHLDELGINAVQILPVQEFPSDPTRFNWGYFTANFMSPEGMYASSEVDGHARIRELRALIDALHSRQIAVVLDIVLNHSAEGSAVAPAINFKGMDSKYWYRQDPRTGTYRNGSGVGNELKSENPMVRRFMVDTCRFWVERYHVDGFRFDLLALLDLTTVDAISQALVVEGGHQDLYLYGEPWAASDALWAKGALNDNLYWSVFNDDFRNIVKGSPDGTGKGFIEGAGNAGMLMSALSGSTVSLDPSARAWAQSPLNSLVYMTAHDNLTLNDKLEVTVPLMTDEQKQQRARLGAALNLTALGPTFFHGGEEFLRSKPYIECEGCDGRPYTDADSDTVYDSNSYSSSDETNNFDWRRKEQYQAMGDYWRQLMLLRSGEIGDAFKRTSAPDEAFVVWAKDSVNPLGVAYIMNHDLTSGAHRVAVFANGSGLSPTTVGLTLPEGNGEWRLLSDGYTLDPEGLSSQSPGELTLTLEPLEHLIFADGF